MIYKIFLFFNTDESNLYCDMDSSSIRSVYWVFKEHIAIRSKAVISHDILKVHFCITDSNLVKIRSTLFRFGIQHLLAMACDVILSCSCIVGRRLIHSSLRLRQAQFKLIPIDSETFKVGFENSPE